MWYSVRDKTIDRILPDSISINTNFLLTNSSEARLGLVGKLLGGVYKQSLGQLHADATDQIYELETANFLDGIRVVRSLIIDRINYYPAVLNRFHMGMELLVRWKGVSWNF
ncbi:hypothetical protein AYI70_g8497 [Smittium culicis]|uniref:Uncharacterized protein n=1 Tax=Smittium culicis TaxID=133412 RepID=A0A1R1XFM0_9FUNG|nr:hypothetical protein AYI70_g8497 [Smittium culicis]